VLSDRFVRSGGVRSKENRKAEGMANGEAGAPNQYGRYFDGQKL
jgi:hypothetical protein